MPTNLGDHVITREKIEACCDDRPSAEQIAKIPARARPALVAGIDWGGGAVSGTVLVLGYIETNLTFHIVRFDRWQPHADPATVVEEMARRCRQFRVQWTAADGGGNGLVYNRLLLDRLRSGDQMPSLYAIYYSGASQPPIRDGALIKWTVHRSASIAAPFGRIKKRLLRFPRLSGSSSFLAEFTCESSIYDEEWHTLKFTKPKT